MAHYGKEEYWEDRYMKDKDPYDWYQRYNGIKDTITQYIQPDNDILMLGCGNSRMSEAMFEDSYQNITNVDISQTVIDMMSAYYKEKIPSMTFAKMDAKNLSGLESDKYDAVIDKACFDSVLCGDNSGPNSEAMLNEVYRVLNASGVYICITYGVPEKRLSYFNNKNYEWNITTQRAAKPYI